MKSIKLFRLWGADIILEPTFWLLPTIFILWPFLQGSDAVSTLSSIAYLFAWLTLILLHEFGHVFIARRYGLKAQEIRFGTLGAAALVEGKSRGRGDVMISLAGPGMNLILGVIGLALLIPVLEVFGAQSVVYKATAFFIAANFVLMLFNLLPILPLDGGQALRGLLSGKLGHDKATIVTSYICYPFAACLGLYGLYEGSILLPAIALVAASSSYREGAVAKRNLRRSPYL